MNMILSRRFFVAALCSSASLPKPFRLANASSPEVEVNAYRQPGCGCCEVWVERMNNSGFRVSMVDDEDLAGRRERLGVPTDLAGCHIAMIGSYVFEGHVPPEDIRRFLGGAPQALGLAVPGMPMGSPGMDQGGSSESYDVIEFSSTGSRRVYASH